MVQMFLPKIHRMRRRIRRQMARQRQLLEDAASQFPDPKSEEWGAPGETLEEVPHPSMYDQEIGDEEREGLPECPADLITCPTPSEGTKSNLAPPTSHFQHVEHGIEHGEASHQGFHQQSQQSEPGPMPGVRPPMGGAGGIVPPPQAKGSGAMGIIMPLYTVGIVVFFVYTIMKVLFKKGQEDDKTPKLKDFGLDPEYRKYVFAEEYLDNTDVSTKDQYRRQTREESRNRKKAAQTEVQPDTKIGEGDLLDQGRMDTQGKKLGEWYLPEGYLDQVDDSEDESLFSSIGGTTVEDSARDTLRERLFVGKQKGNVKTKQRQRFCYQDVYNERDIQDIVDFRRRVMENQRNEAADQEDLGDSTDEDLDEDEALLDLEYLYSEEFRSMLKKSLKNYDPDGNFDEDSLEKLCEVARDHLREKYIENRLKKQMENGQESDQLGFKTPGGQQPYPMEGEQSDEDLYYPEDSSQEDYGTPTTPSKTAVEDERVDILSGNSNPDFSERSNEDRPANFMEPESEDELEFPKEPMVHSRGGDLANKDALEEVEHQMPDDMTEGKEGKSECEKKDEQLDQLRRRLEETEKAMERLMCQMGSVTDKLTAAKITEVLSQAQAQAKILKEEVGEMTSEEDMTSSEAVTTTMSGDTSLPTSLQRHLEEIQVEQLSSYSELLSEVGQLPMDATLPLGISIDSILSQQAISKALDNIDSHEGRTVIQLQELKDDEVSPSEELEPSEDIPDESVKQAESFPAGEESKDDSTPKEQDAEEAKAQERPTEEAQEQESVLPEEEKDAQLKEPPNLLEVTLPTPVAGNIDFIDEPIAEAEELAPVAPPSKETTPKPTVEAPLPIARELSSEGSSEATETGADISDLRSFAEENQAAGQAVLKEKVDGNAATQENSMLPLNQVTVEHDEESESVCKGQGTQTSFAFSIPTPQIDSKEDSTQTEKEQEVAVLGLNTSFRHDEGGVETKAGSQGPVASQQVTEILLDALLPSETQLLVRDSQVVGSSPAQDIEIEASEAGAVPCVVTSNVSLAFLGLEQRDDITPSPTYTSTLVAEATHTEPKAIPSQETQDVEIAVPQPEILSKAAPCEALSSSESPQEKTNLQASVPQLEVASETLPVESSALEYPGKEAIMEIQPSATQPEAVPEMLPVQSSVPESPVEEGVMEIQSSVTQPEVVPENVPVQSYVPESPVEEAVMEIQSSATKSESAPETLPVQSPPVTESLIKETVMETLSFATQPELVLEPLQHEVPSVTEPPVSDIATQPSEEFTKVPQEVNSETKSMGGPSKEVSVSASKESSPVIGCTRMPEQPLSEKADLGSGEKISDIEDPERKVTSKVALMPERDIGEPHSEVLPRPSSPLPPHVPEDEEETEASVQVEKEEQESTPQIPITPSLEAIAEAVAAATTRAALDLLATAKPETLMKQGGTQALNTKSTFMTEEIPTDQSPISTDESSSATTVIAVSETEDVEVTEPQTHSTAAKFVNGAPTESSTVYVATISHTPSGSPSSTPELDLSGETVEAALAEAAQEEILNSSLAKSISHEEPATQEGPSATTVSPVRSNLTMVLPTLTH